MKKLLILLLVSAAAISILLIGIGCSKEEAPAEEVEEEEEVTKEEEEAPAEEEKEGAAPAEEAIEIILWTGQTSPAYKEFYDYVAAEYNRRNPNITIEWQAMEPAEYSVALKVAVAAGEAPDLYEVQVPGFGPSWAEAGELLDITDIVKGDPDWKSYIEPALVYDDAYIDGKMYFVPQSVQHRGIYYWKEMWPNGFPKTLDELWVEADRLINELGIAPLSAGAKDQKPTLEQFQVYTNQLDPTHEMIRKAERGEISWVNDTFKESMQVVKDLYDYPVFHDDYIAHSSGDAWDLFLGFKSAAYWFEGEGFVSIIKEKAEAGEIGMDDVGWAYLPLTEGGEKAKIGGVGATMAVNAKGDYVDHAIEILKLTNEPDAQEILFEYLTLPPGEWFAERETGISLFDAILKEQYAEPLYYSYIDNDEIRTKVFDEMKEMYLGKSVDDTLTAIDEFTQNYWASQ